VVRVTNDFPPVKPLDCAKELRGFQDDTELCRFAMREIIKEKGYGDAMLVVAATKALLDTLKIGHANIKAEQQINPEPPKAKAVVPSMFGHGNKVASK